MSSTDTINPAPPQKKKSLINRLVLKNWIDNKLMKKMDKHTNARSTFILTLLAFFLGRNLTVYLWLLMIITMYVLIYRAVRFWVKRWLLYLLEFCYPGNFLLLSYIFFFSESENVFLMTYMCSSGVMAVAVIIFNNQAELSNTDFLTSAFIHTMPVTTVWALRWRHIIYPQEYLGSGFTFAEMGNISFELNAIFYKLLYLPFLFWICWAILYFIITMTVLKKLVWSEVYEGGVSDFIKGNELEIILGDHKRYSIWKYLLEHFIVFVIVLPIAVLCFYNFYFNCAYITFIILFLGWNTGRNRQKHIQKELMKAELHALEEKDQNKKHE